MNVPSELHADGSACDRSTEPYDELALVLEELKELNLPLQTVPAVRRETFPLSDGRVLSVLPFFMITSVALWSLLRLSSPRADHCGVAVERGPLTAVLFLLRAAGCQPIRPLST